MTSKWWSRHSSDKSNNHRPRRWSTPPHCRIKRRHLQILHHRNGTFNCQSGRSVQSAASLFTWENDVKRPRWPTGAVDKKLIHKSDAPIGGECTHDLACYNSHRTSDLDSPRSRDCRCYECSIPRKQGLPGVSDDLPTHENQCQVPWISVSWYKARSNKGCCIQRRFFQCGIPWKKNGHNTPPLS